MGNVLTNLFNNICLVSCVVSMTYCDVAYGASGSIGIRGTIDGKGGFNFNASTNKMDSDYKSVSEQAGIYAGKRGFDINVEGNTDLKGAVIASEAGYDKNNLNTGTITFSDINNKAEYSTKGYGVSYSGLTNKEKAQSGRKVMQGDKGFIPNIPMASGDEDESSTQSAIANGTITIRNKEAQKQDINELRRETKNTLNKLDKIFDKEKIEEKQELAGLFSELSFNALHEVTKNWNSEQKAMAHMAIGYISAEMADSKEPLSVALAAGVNKYVVEKLIESKPQAVTLKNKDGNDVTLNVETNKTKIYFNEHPDELQWISAAIGAGIGQITGSTTSAFGGASIAASGTKNNKWYVDVPLEEVFVVANNVYADSEDKPGLPHIYIVAKFADGRYVRTDYGSYAAEGLLRKARNEDLGVIIDSDYSNFSLGKNEKIIASTNNTAIMNKIRQNVNSLEDLDGTISFKNPTDSGIRQDKINDNIQKIYRFNPSYQAYNVLSNNCLSFIQFITKDTGLKVNFSNIDFLLPLSMWKVSDKNGK